MTAYQTDYEAITGVLLGRNAFYVAPRAAAVGTATPPGKRGPKPKPKVKQEKLIAPLPSKWNGANPAAMPQARPAFNVHIATADESRRTNSIGGRK